MLCTGSHQGSSWRSLRPQFRMVGGKPSSQTLPVRCQWSLDFCIFVLSPLAFTSNTTRLQIQKSTPHPLATALTIKLTTVYVNMPEPHVVRLFDYDTYEINMIHYTSTMIHYQILWLHSQKQRDKPKIDLAVASITKRGLMNLLTCMRVYTEYEYFRCYRWNKIQLEWWHDRWRHTLPVSEGLRGWYEVICLQSCWNMEIHVAQFNHRWPHYRLESFHKERWRKSTSGSVSLQCTVSSWRVRRSAGSLLLLEMREVSREWG